MAQARINGDRDENVDIKEFAPASVVGLINNVENGTAEIETLQTEVSDWVETHNQPQTWIDWRFTTADARLKLKRLYPSINS